MKIVVRNRSDDFIDEMTDARLVARAMPQYSSDFDNLHWIRQHNELLRNIGAFKFGNFTHVARLPRAVYEAWYREDPEIFQKKSKWWARADKHPEYLTYRRKRGA